MEWLGWEPQVCWRGVAVYTEFSEPTLSQTVVICAMPISLPVALTEATDKHVCDLANGFYEELCKLHVEKNVESAVFLQKLSRLHCTGHQNRVENIYEEYGLQAPIPVTDIKLAGRSQPQQVLRVQDILQTLSDHGKMDAFLHGHRGPDFHAFWMHFEQLEPAHRVYSVHRSELRRCVPYMLHSDEGTGMKKKLS